MRPPASGGDATTGSAAAASGPSLAQSAAAPGMPDGARAPGSRLDPLRLRLDDAVVLFGAILLLVLGASLDVGRDAAGGEQVLADGRALPPLCFFRTFTGVPCAGCGITRSTIALLHGDPVGAHRHHPLGAAIVLLLAAQIPYRGALLVSRSARAHRLSPAWTGRIFYAGTTLLLACWFVRLCSA